MKYKVVMSSRFAKDLKIIAKRGYDLNLIKFVISELANGKHLDPKYKDHQLQGNYMNKRECHILPDWLLIYEIIDNELLLYLARTGSHSDLF